MAIGGEKMGCGNGSEYWMIMSVCVWVLGKIRKT